MEHKSTGALTQAPAEHGTSLIRLWVGPAILFLLGAAGLVGGLLLGVYVDGHPGPGLWPTIVSAVIIASSIVMGPQHDTETITGREVRGVVSAMALLVLFVVLFNMIGIFFPSLVVLFLWMRFLARRSWLQTILISVITAGVFHLVFTVVFKVGI